MSGYQSFTFTTLDAVEASAIIDLGQGGAPSRAMAFSTVQTGSPATATLVIYGSIDGVNFFDISGNQAAASNLLFFVIDKPVRYLRANLTALSGGTAPTVTVTGLALCD